MTGDLWNEEISAFESLRGWESGWLLKQHDGLDAFKKYLLKREFDVKIGVFGVVGGRCHIKVC